MPAGRSAEACKQWARNTKKSLTYFLKQANGEVKLFAHKESRESAHRLTKLESGVHYLHQEFAP
jgi:hypothetical protein